MIAPCAVAVGPPVDLLETSELPDETPVGVLTLTEDVTVPEGVTDVSRNGLMELPPLALVRSKVKALIELCWEMSAEGESCFKAEPCLTAQIQDEELEVISIVPPCQDMQLEPTLRSKVLVIESNDWSERRRNGGIGRNGGW